MVASELTDVLSEKFPGEPASRDFQKQVEELTRPSVA
jgi:hypothetical protein